MNAIENLAAIRARVATRLVVRPGLRLTYRGNGTCLAASTAGLGVFGVYRIDAARGLVLVDFANSDAAVPVLYLNPAELEAVEAWAFADDGWVIQ